MLSILPLVSWAQNTRYFIFNNVKPRPLAMGGAFVALEDDIAAINYNPASFSLYAATKSKRLTFFLNPISPFVGGIENGDLFNGSGSTLDDLFSSISLLVKSISLSLESFEFGLLLGEESLSLPEEFARGPFDINGFRQNHSHSFVGRIKLADRVSLGGTATLLYGSKTANPAERTSDVGISYGILLKPETGLKIGVAFFNLPDSLKDARVPMERIVDESVNIGISYQLFHGMTKFALDIRNLGEETQTAVREFHFGLEQVLMSQMAVRAGYFQKDSEDRVFSWGVGLLDGNTLFDPENSFTHRNFLFNYAFIYENSRLGNNQWHLLSFHIRL